MAGAPKRLKHRTLGIRGLRRSAAVCQASKSGKTTSNPFKQTVQIFKIGNLEMMIEGLDPLMSKLKELEGAALELDGEIAQLTFDPCDPQSIEQAIQDLYAAIDEKVAGYASNEIVLSIAEGLKETGREAILEQAATARLDGGVRE